MIDELVVEDKGTQRLTRTTMLSPHSPSLSTPFLLPPSPNPHKL